MDVCIFVASNITMLHQVIGEAVHLYSLGALIVDKEFK